MAVAKQKITDEYAIYNGDCMDVMETMPDESIHLSIYSPPFGGLYHYSSSSLANLDIGSIGIDSNGGSILSRYLTRPF